LVRGGEPVLVSERSATKALKTWDRIAARMVEHNGKMTMARGLLPFTLEASEGLFSRLRNCSPDAAAKRPGGASKAGALNGWRGSDDDMRRAAPLFTSAWLFDVLPQALRTDPPKLFNSDGDEILFHRVNFPLTEAASADEIAARLDQLADLRRSSATFWNWLGERAASGAMAKSGKGITFNSKMEDGSPVLGTIELNELFVLFEANSPARAQRGTVMLAAALGDLVGSPLTEIQTVEQLKAAPRRRPDEAAAAIPPEVQEKLVHEPVLDLRRKRLRRFLRSSRKSSCTRPSTNTIAPRWTNPRRCWAMCRRARRPARLRGAKISSSGSSTWRISRSTRQTGTIQWRPTISHGYGAN